MRIRPPLLTHYDGLNDGHASPRRAPTDAPITPQVAARTQTCRLSRSQKIGAVARRVVGVVLRLARRARRSARREPRRSGQAGRQRNKSIRLIARWARHFKDNALDTFNCFVRSHDLLFPSASPHVASLLFTSSASDPNHCTLTTVTSASGGIPRTAALGWRSSRRVMFFAVLAFAPGR